MRRTMKFRHLTEEGKENITNLPADAYSTSQDVSAKPNADENSTARRRVWALTRSLDETCWNLEDGEYHSGAEEK